ncbi:MAG: amidohydrolase family protein [Actinobacteria bacterium]|nr:amidohydrolase family protein [Actinomycetota bacterium]
MENGVVVLDQGEITYAGAANGAPDPGDAEVVKTETVMPGMWECHGHFFGIYTANIDEAHLSRPQLLSMRVTSDARVALDAGFTSVREMGGLGVFLGRAVEEGVVVGPNVYGAGGTLSMTAGHADTHSVDLDMARALHVRFGGEDNIVDGPDQCRAGVRRMLRLGAKVIKIHASGGVMSELDDPHLPQFSNEELNAIVDEANRMERLVGAHCHGKRGIMSALEAGVKTIEHGTFLDDEAAEAMVEAEAILVPTRFIVDLLIREGEQRGMPEYAKKKIRMTAEAHSDAISLAIEKGVKIAMGTDIWATGVWGRNGEELDLMVECGMTPMQAIEAATANGPATLGPQAPKSGRLEEGLDADVICVSGDPTGDVSILADPDNITHVFKGGVRYKG